MNALSSSIITLLLIGSFNNEIISLPFIALQLEDVPVVALHIDFLSTVRHLWLPMLAANAAINTWLLPTHMRGYTMLFQML